jgi:hypothetical protein
MISATRRQCQSPFYLAMTVGTLLTHWSARITFLLYAAAVAAWLIGNTRAARLAWTSGFLVYLTHVAAAFHFRHHWSHVAAYEETARQTAALFGVRSGVGLYCNYVFTAVWALDVIWMWWSAETYRRRRRWIGAAIHCFMAFLFFNATVVFVSGWVRWLGLMVSIALGILWLRMKRARRQTRLPHDDAFSA